MSIQRNRRLHRWQGGKIPGWGITVLGTAIISIVLAAGQVSALPEQPDANVPETSSTVFAIVQSGNVIYLGGDFAEIGGVSRRGLAAFDATTGEVDSNWNPKVLGRVYTIVVYGGKVYAGGDFSKVSGTIIRNHLAAFELAGSGKAGLVDPDWNPNITGSRYDDVYALVVDGTNERVYAGGAFKTVNGSVARHRLAAFELAGESKAGLCRFELESPPCR